MAAPRLAPRSVQETPGPAAGAPGISSTAFVMLAVATLGFGVNFWAWALVSPLGPYFTTELGLSSFQKALLVALPVLVGSLGRIPVGALTDRFGARVMFPLVSFVTVLPVLFVGHVANDSYGLMLLGGFFLGIGGTAFAVGVPFVNAWFPPERRGLALGVFGVGMGGTAISAFTTVKLKDAQGVGFPFTLVAVLLLAYGILAIVMVRDAPGRVVAQGSFLRRAWDTFRMRTTLQLSFLYAVGFGGFVAFSVYLPTYLKDAYGLSQNGAAIRTAGFVVLAVAMRPVGGWVSDRLHPVPVLVACFAAVAVFAAVAALELDLVPIGTIAFLSMAAALGAASGAVFALVALVAPGPKVGSVTGVVGAAGGLGGFVPPLVMGAIYGSLDDYSLGFVLLSLVAAAAGTYTWLVMRGTGTAAAA